MAFDLSQTLVAGVSSRALFDLSKESIIFDREGLEAYKAHQLANEDVPLLPGAAFPLIKALLKLNEQSDSKRLVEVVLMSKNSAYTGLRVRSSIMHHGLDVTRAVFTSGASTHPYHEAFGLNLFLSQDESDVEAAVAAGFPAAVIYDVPANPLEELDEIRIAFDGDAVLFDEESERIYQEQGLEAFQKHEEANARNPLADGPFAKFLRAISSLQNECTGIRTALVTARGAPSDERVIRTLKAWDVDIDESIFLGGVPKGKVLEAFKPQIFFDDHPGHIEDAHLHNIPGARVPSGVRKIKETNNS